MKYFQLQEIVDKKSFEKYGEQCWQLFPENSLVMLDNLREFFACPISCNDWFKGGQFQYRGYRPKWCNVGAVGSAHRVGMAFDLDVKGYTAEEARGKILSNKNNPLLSNIMRLEGGVDWLHIDRFEPPVGKDRIYVFKV